MNLAIICPGPSINTNIILLKKIKEKIPNLKVLILNETKLIDLLKENDIVYDYFACFTKETLKYHQKFLPNIKNLITSSQALSNINFTSLNNILLCDRYIKNIYKIYFKKNYNFSNLNGKINSLMCLLYSLKNLNQSSNLNIYLFGVDGVKSKDKETYFVDFTKTIYSHDYYHSEIDIFNSYKDDQENFEKVYQKLNFNKLDIFNCNSESSYKVFKKLDLDLLKINQNNLVDLKFSLKEEIMRSVNIYKFEQIFADVVFNLSKEKLDDFIVKLIHNFFDRIDFNNKISQLKTNSYGTINQIFLNTNKTLYEKYSLIFALSKFNEIFLKLAFSSKNKEGKIGL